MDGHRPNTYGDSFADVYDSWYGQVSDAEEQTVSGQHIELADTGVRLRPWARRWVTPRQMVEMAAAAGLSLRNRYSDWNRSPMEAGSDTHISVYQA